MQSISDISVQYVKGVGPSRKKTFSRLGVETIEDLFYFFPRRYEDRRNITPIAKTTIGDWQTICGKVISCDARKSWHTKKHVTEVVLDDKSGRLFCVWFNQPYLSHYFKPGYKAVCYGKIDMYKKRLQMVSPEYEIIKNAEDESLQLSRIVPIYPLTKGVTQRFLRKIVMAGLEKYIDQIEDELPVVLRNKHRLYNIKRSIRNLHFPENPNDQENALKRISFEEFFFFQISIMLRRFNMVQKQGIAHRVDPALPLKYIHSFPFDLTSSQQKVMREIVSDMQAPGPMLRLLQGDVGSGKTIIAIFGCLISFQSGCQSCIMAPTEILAKQHYETIQAWVKTGVLKGVKTALLTSHLNPKEKKGILDRIHKGQVDLIIGTHALINEEVSFKKLSYVVIDEQHKFGVRQRAMLSKKGTNPDILIMTATPIPRTLYITLYGDLDVSIIDEMPPGRGKTETRAYDPLLAEDAYAIVREKVLQGQQAYIVYPIIEESEKFDLKAAADMYKLFQKHPKFKDFRIGLVHGRLKSEETTEIMKDFKEHNLDILIATTVLEVGIDVPNANVMVIEHAERFGLAQLHQLRGRIGRGREDALCLLIALPVTEEGQARMKAILSSTNGFKIAEQDLLIRGPGHFFGRQQHGLNELKVANPVTQLDILELARKEAQDLMKDDGHLVKAANSHIKEVIQRRYPSYLKDVEAG